MMSYLKIRENEEFSTQSIDFSKEKFDLLVIPKKFNISIDRKGINII